AKQNLERAEQEKERAEQSEKFKQQFLANMSHEIRTPLNAIKGMTLMLLKENQSEQQKKNLDIIRRSTDNLIVIINDILDLSKIEAGKLELENIDFSLQHTLDNVYELLRFKAVEKGIGFSVHTSQQVPKALKGDPVRLGQVLMNLAGNAIKFTEKGSVTITAELLATENNSSTVEISVIDTGIGIAEDQIGKVFESFSQAGKDTYRKFGGTGLGLTISKSLVEMMHGKIQLRSKYGEGTTFFFSITLPNGDESKLENDSSAESDIPKLKDIRILLFEDNLFNQIVAQQTLNSLIEGLKLEIAENGLIGIDKLKAADYDILLMDIQMPEMDGYEATKKIREEGGEKKDIAIMAMTANATKEEIQKCIASGMNDYITKPFEPNDLLRKIHKLILKKN
ncbi:MAG TPA: hybrid sensor histidine kinase/response regulator, partial [Bacteroidetes bacterium]|nr:hybrid sensor histidine kinase/response regulator [Bacteroidota bacterium]